MTIDTTKIEGYAEMTAEQKLAALEAFDVEVPKPDYSGYIKKDVFDKTASELAKLKKEQLDKLDEAEKAKVLAEQELKDLRDRNAELEKNAKIAEYKAKYLARGYDDALADETARAYVDGDTEKVFANHDKFMENHDKQIKASMLGGTGTPPAGSGDGYKSKEDIMNIKDTQERQAAIAANPTLFGIN